MGRSLWSPVVFPAIPRSIARLLSMLTGAYSLHAATQLRRRSVILDAVDRLAGSIHFLGKAGDGDRVVVKHVTERGELRSRVAGLAAKVLGFVLAFACSILPG